MRFNTRRLGVRLLCTILCAASMFLSGGIEEAIHSFVHALTNSLCTNVHSIAQLSQRLAFEQDQTCSIKQLLDASIGQSVVITATSFVLQVLVYTESHPFFYESKNAVATDGTWQSSRGPPLC